MLVCSGRRSPPFIVFKIKVILGITGAHRQGYQSHVAGLWKFFPLVGLLHHAQLSVDRLAELLLVGGVLGKPHRIDLPVGG